MFEDLGEQGYAFERLDDWSSYPDSIDITSYTGYSSYLSELLTPVMLGVENLEKETINKNPNRDLKIGFSYHSEILRRLYYLLNNSNTPAKLLANLQDIKILLLQAMVIGLELKSGKLELVSNIGNAVINGGKRGHARAYGTPDEISEERKKWQSWIDAAIKYYPTYSFEYIKKYVVKNHKEEVSIHQLKRYTKDSRKE